MAGTVTITRDSWGVPHITAPTDAGAAFGVGYAQAEDNIVQIEEDYLHALGRAAGVYGRSALEDDLVRAAFEVERLARDEYEREPVERRALWDAYSDGLNHYLRTHPRSGLRAIRRFEPWFPFALMRTTAAQLTIDGVRLGDVLATPVGELRITAGRTDASAGAEAAIAGGAGGLRTHGNSPMAWAVAPSRTRDRAALLFLNPGADFTGNGQLWEVHVSSDEGWNVYGFALLGTPVPRSGHNGTLGWTHTATTADVADAFVEAFDHPTDPLAYRYGEEWLQAVPFEAELAVSTVAGLERRRYRFLKTHRGPVIAMPGGDRATVRIARLAEGGALQQWYAMGRATSLEQFRTALDGTALPAVNTLYADRDGNLFHVHGNAVPRRDAHFDHTRPLDGSDPATDWRDYHALTELPQLLNPASGWIQDAGGSPFHVTAAGHNPDSAAYPAYMASRHDDVRAATARRIVSSDTSWTLREWESATFDLRVQRADTAIPGLVDEWERLGAQDPGRAVQLDRSIELLRGWDRVSSIGSAAMTVFVMWSELLDRSGSGADGWPRVSALESVMATLVSDWGTEAVAWGEVNRLRRAPPAGAAETGAIRADLPVAGAPGSLGIVFDYETTPGQDGRRREGRRGHGWVGVVEFGSPVRARSIVAFGQSADPVSPHWFDQAPLWTRGQYRPAWFSGEDIAANATLRYRPGDRPGPASGRD